MSKLDRTNIEDILPLSHMQAGMLFYYLKDQDKDLYVEQLSLELTGEIQWRLFTRAWDYVIQANPALRTSFRWEKMDHPVQVVHKHLDFKPLYYDLSHLEPSILQQRLEEIKASDRRGVDLETVFFKVTLCKTAPQSYHMVTTNHHILYDGWSNGVILKELFGAYNDYYQKRTPPAPTKNTFKAYLKWLGRQPRREREKFWKNYLSGYENAPRLKETAAKPSNKSGRREHRNLKVSFSPLQIDNLEQFCREHNITLAALLYVAWGILLQKYNNCDDVVFGTSVSGRTARVEGIEQMVGLFTNTLPLRVRCPVQTTLEHLLIEVHQSLQARQPFENTPLVEMNRYGPGGEGGELFDTLVTIENYPLDKQLKRTGGPLVPVDFTIKENNHYDLSIGIMLFDGMEINISYQAAYFDSSLISLLAGHYWRILECISENPQLRPQDLCILSQKELQRLIDELNGPQTHFPTDKTLTCLLEEQVRRTPDHIALIGPTLSLPQVQITYGQLLRQVNRLAAHLHRLQPQPPHLAALMVEPSIQMITALLAILKSGAAYLPLDSHYPGERILYMLNDSNTPILLTTTALVETSPELKSWKGRIITLDRDLPALEQSRTQATPARPPATVLDAAYTIYTSGSTGQPKGVLISHRSAVNLALSRIRHFQMHSRDRVLQFSSISFDASLEQIMIALFSGASLVLVSRHTLLDPVKLANHAARLGITHLNSVPSYLDHLEPEHIPYLKRIITGGAACPPALALKLARHCDLYNQYGPTETTITSTSMRFPHHSKPQPPISIGAPIDNTWVCILDRHRTPMPLGVTGELYIGGAGVGTGYLNNPELTAERFIQPTSFTLLPPSTSHRLYRTGDLARWLPGGNLEYLGRADNQVKIRGFRIEPEEIREHLNRHPGINDSLVTLRESAPGEAYLCAYIVPAGTETPSHSALHDHLSISLPDYMTPARYVILDSIPLGPSGKVDLAALPEPGIMERREYTPPANKIETKLVEIWASVLGHDASSISVYDNFFQLGGHSLKAIALVSRIQKYLQKDISIGAIFEAPTIRGITARMDAPARQPVQPIPPVEEQEYYPLSPSQQQFYVLYRLAPQSVAYNMPFALQLDGKLDAQQLDNAFDTLIRGQESLRTSFILVNHKPVQRIHPNPPFEIIRETLTPSGDIDFNAFIRPFDLSRPPLLRVKLIRRQPDRHILMVDMHHIISDGISSRMLIKEFSDLYSGAQPPAPQIRYRDYAAWRNSLPVNRRIRSQAQYWHEQFSGDIPRLHLPYDLEPPAVPGFNGAAISFELDDKRTNRLTQAAANSDMTLFMMLMAAFNIFLARISGQCDIVVGTPVSGRPLAELEQVTGVFINTLAIKNSPSHGKTIRAFLKEIKHNTLRANENQDYPFQQLVDHVEAGRENNNNPLFDVMLTLQEDDLPDIQLPSLHVTPIPFNTHLSKFHLMLEAVRSHKTIKCAFKYNTGLFEPAAIQRFTSYFNRVLDALIDGGDLGIWDIGIMPPQEKEQVLFHFNRTDAHYPRHKTLHQLFGEQASKTPYALALTGPSLEDAHGSNWHISYAHLDAVSSQLAETLNRKGKAPGTIIAIQMERSVQQIIAILAILKAGSTYLPIDPGYPQERIDYLLKDSNAALCLDHKIYKSYRSYKTDNKTHGTDDNFDNFARGPAYIIYTSGSTGSPKGVMVEHGSVVNLVWSQTREFGFQAAERVLQFSSISFDASVEQIFLTLLNGALLALIDQDTLLDPHRFDAFIHTYSITHLHAVPSFLAQLKLTQPHPIKRILSGGDVCPPLLAKTLSRFPQCDFYNRYGPTETTVTNLIYKAGESPDAMRRIPIGSPMSNTRVYLLDFSLNPVPIGVTGEMVIGGDCVTPGYLNRPELTAQRFVHPPTSTRHPASASQRLYRTGDLARWLPSGHVEFIGRMDQQVKIRGFRIEPGEIENRLLSHPHVKEAAVIEHRSAPEKNNYLCAYVVPEITTAEDFHSTLREYLDVNLPSYMIPSFFITLDHIPRTTSGKLDRKQLPEPGDSGFTTPYTAPRNLDEEALASLWEQILDIDSSQIGIDHNFFHLGGHSLNAVELTARIHRRFSVDMSLSQLFHAPTIRGLAHFIRNAGEDTHDAIRPVEEREYYPLSPAQKRFYLLHRMDPQSTAYNISSSIIIEGALDLSRMKQAMQALIQHQDNLRTAFIMVGEQPVQVIHPHVSFEITVLNGAWNEDRLKRFIQPFDLTCPPLLRVRLVRPKPETHILMLDMHHIISDHISSLTFVKQFSALYAGETLAPLSITYKDYCHWLTAPAVTRRWQKQEAFWLERFQGELPQLNPPRDFKRPATRVLDGGSVIFQLPEEQTHRLKLLAHRHDCTLFMLMLGLFNIFLSRISGQQEILVGAPVSGRRRMDLEPIMGIFINTLVHRNYPLGAKSLTTFLNEIKETSLAAHDNQDYPYEQLVEKIVLNRDAARNPLFDVMFSLQEYDPLRLSIPGLELEPLPRSTGTSMFDLSLEIQASHILEFTITYSTALFKADTIHRFSGYISTLIEGAIAHPEAAISDIPMLPEYEKQELLNRFNRAAGFPSYCNIHELFDRQVQRSPYRTALIAYPGGQLGRPHHLTYKTMSDQSLRLARHLSRQGARPGGMIGILVERGPLMVIGPLAALITGCAYVPLNPTAPPARNKYIMDECSAHLLLTDDTNVDRLNMEPLLNSFNILDMDDILSQPPDDADEAMVLPQVSVHDYAYVIFTSGSTGTPKGVPITHANLSPLLHWGYQELAIGIHDRVIQNVSFYFDFSAWEIFMTITSGASMYMTPETMPLGGESAAFLNRNQVTILHVTPTQLQYFLESGQTLQYLKYLYIGGETLFHDLVRRVFRQVPPKCRVFNMYGPTETTIITTAVELPPTSGHDFSHLNSIPIGAAIANLRLLVLDMHMNLCPLNVTGQLYIGGDGLANGYLNKPELTGQRFVKHIIQSRNDKQNPVSRHLSSNPQAGQFPGIHRLYDTGDLVRWVDGGLLEFLGRIDHQVKIRGFRIELGEIESRLTAHQQVKEAIVLARESQGGEKYLCAYIVANPGTPPAAQELRDSLSASLPAYMVPAFFVILDAMPLNPNGKVDRKALPQPRATGGGGQHYAPPVSQTQKRLAAIWAELLAVPQEEIGIHDDFFLLGGHSLKAVQLISRIHKEFSVQMPIVELFSAPTINELSANLSSRTHASTSHRLIPAREKKQYYPLSSTQQRLYFLQLRDQDTAYNISAAWTLEGNVDLDKLHAVFLQIANAHDSLRTSFQTIHHEPAQVVHDDIYLPLERLDRVPAIFARPFDPAHAPLWRIAAVQNQDRCILLMDMHHLITDGVSMELFQQEFISIYSGAVPNPPRLQYKDYVLWEQSPHRKQLLKQQESFWLTQFQDEIPVLEMFTDFNRPAARTSRGRGFHFTLVPSIVTGLHRLAQRTGSTLYMVLLAAYNILLNKLSNQEDIIVGTPAAARCHTDLEHIFGMFVNTLALRSQPKGDITVHQFMNQIKSTTLQAFENQQYPFEELVENLGVTGDNGRAPIFDVAFTHSDENRTAPVHLPGLTVKHYQNPNLTAKFDLLLTCFLDGDQLTATFEYSADLFEEPTIQRFSSYFKEIAACMASEEYIPLSDIPFMSNREKTQLLEDFNRTHTACPKEKTIPQLFKEQANAHPHRIAVIGGSLHGVSSCALTYSEMDKRSGHLAHLLRHNGVNPGAIVAVMQERSLEMIVTLMAILKTGAAYLPFEPDFPIERIQYMLADSNALILLTTPPLETQARHIVSEHYGPGTKRPAIKTMAVDCLDLSFHKDPGPPPDSSALSYIIYTSGSTGKPKGILTKQFNVTRVVKETDYIDITPGDRILQLSNYAFDGSVFDIYGALLNGAALVLIDKDQILNLDRLSRHIKKQQITVFFITTALFNLLADFNLDRLSDVKKILFGGERVSVAHVEKTLARLGTGRLIHVYGPTETTVYASYYFIDYIDHRLGTIPIGKPLANTTAYILNKYLKPVPIGISGELFVGGTGVARGYLNRPELTAEKFIPSPFGHNDSIIYRTGDLARWLPGGDIEFLGRIDNQVKLRGFRIELGEIENQLNGHQLVKESIVIVREPTGGEKYLCAYLVPNEPNLLAEGCAEEWERELRRHLSIDLPGYMIPSFFVFLEQFPLNANGKINTKALPLPAESSATSTPKAPPTRESEEKLLAIWAGVLGLPPQRIGIHDDFFELGGHSLKVVKLVNLVNKLLAVKIPIAEFYKNSTIHDIADYIQQNQGGHSSVIEPAELREYYPLSAAQNRMYLLHRIDPENIGYNMPMPMLLEGVPDTGDIEAAFHALIQRHDILRTSFFMIGEHPYQKVHHVVDFTLQYIVARDAGIEPTDFIAQHFVRPFDLARPPLLRAALIRLEPDKHILVVDMHHIISDGTSLGIMIRQFMQLYNRQEPEPTRLRYIDYAVMEAKDTYKKSLFAQENYWKQQFEEEAPILDLPKDYPRPANQTFAGAGISFKMSRRQLDRLNLLARTENSTLYMIFLALYGILLSRLGNQQDIVIGSPTAGRHHADVQSIIGVFINTLALRIDTSGNIPFNRFLRKVRQTTISAFENQRYQFENLLEILDVTRDISRNPLFDVLLLFQNLDIPKMEIPGLTLTQYPYDSGISKFDLTLVVYENEGELFLSLKYNTNLFKPGTARRFVNYFQKITAAVLENPHIPLANIGILSPEERRQLLLEFNRTGAPHPHGKTIHQLFGEQASKTPHAVAITGPSLEDAQGLNAHITYAHLDAVSSQIAEALNSQGMAPGTIIAIKIERSIQQISAIMAILKAGSAYLPIDPGYPPERIQYLLKDSNAVLCLDHETYRSYRTYRSDKTNTTDRADDAPAHGPAYIIYTSGSTGLPKGVVVEHGSAVNLVYSQAREFGFQCGERVLQFSSISFDASVEQIFLTLLNGALLALADKETLLDGHLLERFIHTRRITHIHAVPAFLAHMTLQAPHPVKRILSGGDLCPVPLARKLSRFPGCDFYNRYGPTETTVTSLEHKVEEIPGDMERVPIGRPFDNTYVYLLDYYLNPVPLGVTAELYIGGRGVSRGYLNRPELTAERFIQPPSSLLQPPSSALYRTGDLARWLPNGDMDFIGRIDHQVKIRGYRIELGEIRGRLLQHPAVSQAEVTAITSPADGDRLLCAYIVTDRDASGVRDYLAAMLPDYMIPTYFMELESMPLTTSGKVNRKKLPLPGPALDGNTFTAPRDLTENILARLWSEILAVQLPDFGIDSNFFHLGGHSLKATLLVSRIHKELDVKISLAQVFKNPTIRLLAQCIKEQAHDPFAAIEPAEKREYYDVSSAQKRMFILQRMDLENTAYNIPMPVMLEGKPDTTTLEKIFSSLIRRHDSLRTSFFMKDEDIVQRIHSAVDFAMDVHNLVHQDIEPRTLIEDRLIRWFDLSCAPLMRLSLIRLEPASHILLLDMHHIISDGTSNGILFKEFMALYAGETLEPPKIQYKDYAQWQAGQRRRGTFKAREHFWLEQFKEEAPVLELPLDFPRPARHTFAGSIMTSRLEPQTTEALHQLALERGATMYMLVLALFNVLLSKLTNQQDIVIGSPIAGRPHEDLQQVIGVFINTLALRNRPLGNLTFNRFLNQLKDRTLAAFENQAFQFEELVEKLDISRDISRNPLFDILFLFQNMDVPEIKIPGLTLSPFEYDTGGSKFDLTLAAYESEGSLSFSLKYNTTLFKSATIRRFLDYLETITHTVLEHPGIPLSGIQVMSHIERQQLLVEFNRTSTPHPRGKTIHRLFTEQAPKTPHAVALTGPYLDDANGSNTHITYAHLDTESSRIASAFRQQGMAPGTIIAIKMKRSVQQIIAIMAILKAGSAYLPIDPGYPPERIEYLLKDSNAVLYLDHETYRSYSTYRADKTDGANDAPAHSPAYIIYTSGSTGLPKGVLVEHGSVVNLVYSQVREFGFQSGERVLQFSSLSFDASVEQIFLTLLNGALLALTDKETLLDNDLFEHFIHTRRITHLHAVPTFLANIKLQAPHPVKRIIAGGDLCPVPLARKLSSFPGCDFYNEYGPTETTVTSMEHKAEDIPAPIKRIPIGKPLDNTQVYLLDYYLNPVPLGVTAELYIGGRGVSRGYLNRPELTGQQFIQPPSHILHPTSSSTRLYRTGDLARWLPNGDMDFIGRIDHQVKIRGYRIELGEIRGRLLQHPAVSQAEVTAITSPADGDRLLCAYIVTDRDASGVRDHLAAVLPDYMLPTHIVELEHMPLTASGKVDRKKLLPPETSQGGVAPSSPRDGVESQLVTLWSQLLAIDASRIGIDSDFFHIGGHSLKATILASRMRKEMGVKITLAQIFQSSTIRTLAQAVRKSSPEHHKAIEPVEKKHYYPLSSQQKRLYFLQQLDEDGISYNMPSSWIIEGEADINRLASVFQILVQRHESLRTSFEIYGGQPVQLIHDHLEIPIERSNSGSSIHHFMRPFNLARAPLCRVAIIEEENRCILRVDMHHIITDGISTEIIHKEFIALYKNRELPPLKLQYKDYAVWQNSGIQKENLSRQESYWLDRMNPLPPRADLPYDFPRPNRPGNEGKTLYFDINAAHSLKLKTMARDNGATLYIVILAALNILLSKLSGQQDIVVGAPVAARRHADLQAIIGMFVNTLPLRHIQQSGDSFIQFLERVKTSTLEAFENQEYQLEDLVEKLGVPRENNRNPLFDVVFALPDTAGADQAEIPGLKISRQTSGSRTAKFDLLLVCLQKENHINCCFEYKTSLFKKETITRFFDYFYEILRSVTDNPDILLEDIEIVNPEKQAQLLKQFRQHDDDRDEQSNTGKGLKLEAELDFDF